MKASDAATQIPQVHQASEQRVDQVAEHLTVVQPEQPSAGRPGYRVLGRTTVRDF